MKIFVKTKPVVKREFIEDGGDGKHFTVSIKTRAKDGKANRAVEKAIAKYFCVPISCVRIISGHTSREKMVEVA